MEIAWYELEGEGEAQGSHACESMRQRRRGVLKCGGGGCHLPLCHAHAPTQIFSNALCVVRWHKQTSLQSSVSSVSNGFVTMHQLSVVQAFLHHGAS